MRSPASTSNFSRFRALPGLEQRLLLEAWWRLLSAALSLRLLPRRVVTAALRETSSPPERLENAGQIPSIALAIGRAAAHHLRPMTCLPRALALRQMLAKRGIPSVLRIGVRKEAATLAAHAWIEVEGEAIGEPAAIEERFRALLPASPASGSQG